MLALPKIRFYALSAHQDGRMSSLWGKTKQWVVRSQRFPPSCVFGSLGTHVAGIAASPLFGVAKGANVVCTRVFNDDLSGDFMNIIAGLQAAATAATGTAAVIKYVCCNFGRYSKCLHKRERLTFGRVSTDKLNVCQKCADDLKQPLMKSQLKEIDVGGWLRKRLILNSNMHGGEDVETLLRD